MPWTGKGAGELNLTGPVEPELFKKILEGHVPDGTGHRLGRREKDGTVLHRPGRDITLSAPKSVSLAALIGGDRRIVTAHDKAVQRTLAWVEKNVVETRLRDPEKGRMVPRGRPEDGGRDVPPRHVPAISIRNCTPTPSSPTCSRARTTNGERWRTRNSMPRRCSSGRSTAANWRWG